MGGSKVAVVSCTTYGKKEVEAAVKRGFELIGGVAAFAAQGERIVLKPNVLWGDSPEKCINTHPEVFGAVGRALQGTGAVLSYGDSPGFGKPESHMRRAGIKAVADELGIGLADFENGREVEFSGSPSVKKFTVAVGALECNGIVSIPKLKTHGLMRLTGAIKNSFGCIPGMLTHAFHVRIPNPYDFAKMLVGLNLLLKPRLYIMDGIVGMEGNGPRGGNPVDMGFLLLSRDPVALDTVMCMSVGLDPKILPTNVFGMEYGLGTCDPSKIEMLGDPIERFVKPDFDMVRTPIVSGPRYRVSSVLKRLLYPRPVIIEGRCVRCGTCVEVCPTDPKALSYKTKGRETPPVYQYKRCIRCFCCQEICPESAIVIKRPLLARMRRRAPAKATVGLK
ncbi:MAG: DUF362 domain-containing protein [Spirochaetes bacterium]|nr:DUF362 domain-containing protein [Spirochaetota bacterium]